MADSTVTASKEVVRLKTVVDDLQTQLGLARGRLYAAMKAEYPFQPGTVVLVDGHRNGGFVARVTCLNVKYGRIEMEVGKRLKSGAFSTFGTRVPSFAAVEPYIEAAGIHPSEKEAE